MSIGKVRVVVLCAGNDRSFGRKPRHLHAIDGKVQIFRFMEMYKSFGIPNHNFRFVVGRKDPYEHFFKHHGMEDVQVVVNPKNKASAVHSLKVGLKGLEKSEEPIVVAFGDEHIHPKIIRQVLSEDNDLVCFRNGRNAPDPIIFKIKPHLTPYFVDDIYTRPDFFTEGKELLSVYFEERNQPYPKKIPHDLNTGAAFVYIMMHAILKASVEIAPEKVTNLLFDYEKYYPSNDLDNLRQTDEYKRSNIWGKGTLLFLRFLERVKK